MNKSIPDHQLHHLKQYLTDNYRTPENYILHKFKSHDLIFLGESHYTKHNLRLFHRIMRLLPAHGIFYLFTEFARREEQPLIDKLIFGRNYDEALAKEIMFRFSVDWGFQEYMDTFKVAWEINQKLTGDQKFHVIGLNDSHRWYLLQKPEDWRNPEIMKKVMADYDEQIWADLILRETIMKGNKALIYSGLNHAFTEYRFPLYRNNRLEGYVDKMGNFVFQKAQKRAITVSTHVPWLSDNPDIWVQPVDGAIDAIMRTIPEEYRYVGFDAKNSPFGELTSTDSSFRHGYDNFNLGIFCDGYIYEIPFEKFEMVSPIPEFINESNLNEARRTTRDVGLRHAILEEFQKAFAQQSLHDLFVQTGLIKSS
ncbi:conserved hypothetical protein [Candidatus Zixiibacteriota bacterium]|nr:conserved hypothetical protein [candidate division Zixibacteria bacterium]